MSNKKSEHICDGELSNAVDEILDALKDTLWTYMESVVVNSLEEDDSPLTLTEVKGALDTALYKLKQREDLIEYIPPSLLRDLDRHIESLKDSFHEDYECTQCPEEYDSGFQSGKEEAEDELEKEFSYLICPACRLKELYIPDMRCEACCRTFKIVEEPTSPTERLISAAAEAVEVFGEDELERSADASPPAIS